MRQLQLGLKAEFPYTKVFILGILLTVLGSTCVVVSVIGIINLAWGYYVGTGMWGGVAVTVSGLTAMYSARKRSSASARVYFLLSFLTCVISFGMLVLSAGGLTYKSNFYRPVRYDSDRHKVTLFLHGSVLGISVLSLACNVLSVIVCCKFMTRQKERQESFKLRRHRRRRSDPNGVRRSSSVRSGSGTPRASANGRKLLFSSERTRKHSRQSSGGSDVGTSLKVPFERSPHRRDSDRSRGSSRSRHSHHRQSSSVSQQSRQSVQADPEVTTSLLQETGHPASPGRHRDGMSSRVARDSVRDSVVTSVSEHLVFDPDEEPPPPYEERRPTADSIPSTGSETDTETLVGSSTVIAANCLPLNIPVTELGGQRQMESLQRQPPPSEARPVNTQHVRSSLSDNSNAVSSPSMGSDLLDNCVSLMRLALTDDREEEDESQRQPEDRTTSPEICALTGARLTPVAAVQPDTVGSNISALTSCVQPSPGSSDTSIPGAFSQVLAGQVPASQRSQSMPVQSSSSPSALPTGIRSPNSAFRPVGRGVMPSSSVPLHNFFSPISAPGSPHHTVYSPVASANSNPRLASNPASPRHTSSLAASSEGLKNQSSVWKKIPLPSSHNQSNKAGSVPTKEVISKNIPGPAEPVSREPNRSHDFESHSLPHQSSRHAPDSKSMEIRARTQFASLPARPTSPKRHSGPQFATFPVRNVKEAAPVVASLDRHHVSRHSGDRKSGGRLGSKNNAVDTHSSAAAKNLPAAEKHTGVTNVDSRSHPLALDPVCRSAGIQATDDGGISSSMDRTHRWVLGTLPSGTQYQGATKNMAHAHLTSQGPRSAMLGAVSKHGGRAHGAWAQSGKAVAGPQVGPSSSSSSQPEPMQSPRRSHVSAFSSLAKSSQPVAPKPIRPVVGESASNGSSPFSSPAKSQSQPVAPKAVRPVPIHKTDNGPSPFSSPAKPQPVAPKPVKPTPVQGSGDGTSSLPARPQPLAPKPVKPVTVGGNTGEGRGAFSSPAKSQPAAPKPIKPGEGVGNGTGAFSAPAKTSEPMVPKPMKPAVGIGSGTAFSPIAAPSTQTVAPKPGKPVPAERSSRSFMPVGGSASSAFSSQPAPQQPVRPVPVSGSPSTLQKAASPSSRLPRYQPGRQQSEGEPVSLQASPLGAFQSTHQRQVPQPQEGSTQARRPQPLPQVQQPPGPFQPVQQQQPQSQSRQAPAIPPRAPPQPAQPQPLQRQPQQLQPHHLPAGQLAVVQNQNQQQDKPLFSLLL